MKAILVILAATLCSTSMAYAGDMALRDQFYGLDTNGDQLLSEAEIRGEPELIRYTNLYPQDAFLFADVNKDGYLTEEEYIANETLVTTD